jgi:hypothetical protein
MASLPKKLTHWSATTEPVGLQSPKAPILASLWASLPSGLQSSGVQNGHALSPPIASA